MGFFSSPKRGRALARLTTENACILGVSQRRHGGDGRKEGGVPMKVIYNDGHVAECAPEEELHILRHNLGNGRACCPREKMLEPATQLLQTDEQTVEKAIDSLLTDRQLESAMLGDKEFLFSPNVFSILYLFISLVFIGVTIAMAIVKEKTSPYVFSIVISGIQLITKEPLQGRNLSIVAVALGVGYGMGANAGILAQAPQAVQLIFGCSYHTCCHCESLFRRT